MPFGMNLDRPDTGHAVRDRLFPGYTVGQRVFNTLGRVGAGFLLGPAGSRLFQRGANAWDNRHNPNNTPLDPSGGYGYNGYQGGIDNTIPGVQMGGNAGGVPLNTGGGYDYQPYSGGIDHTIPPIQYGNDPGMQPGTVPLDTSGGYSYGDVPTDIDRNIPGVRTGGGSGGGSMGRGSAGGGLYTSGTLGGGSVVDPSQWGAYGIGGDGGPQNGGIGQGYALQLLSGGMHEGGGSLGLGSGVMPSFLAGKRAPTTGGRLAPQAVPTRTGGGLPPGYRG
jgi:hypothetical protein